MQGEWWTNRQGVTRDLVQLFTGKYLDATAIGIGFTDFGVCSTYYGYSLVQSRFSTARANRCALSAHEISHNCEGSHCDYLDFICRTMCPSMNGCSCGVHSFGPWEVNDILSALTASSCLGTIRTLPIELGGPAEISYRVLPYGVNAGQRLKVEYFDTTTRAWVLLNTVVAAGGIPPQYTTYTHTTPPAAAGNLFCLRFNAYGNSGNSGTKWYLDDVSITASTVNVPPATTASPLLRDVRPNPFNPRTTVVLDLDRGHTVPTGGYVAQLVSEGRKESRTASLIR